MKRILLPLVALGICFGVQLATPRGAPEPPSTAPTFLPAPVTLVTSQQPSVPASPAAAGLGVREDGAGTTAIGSVLLGGYATFYDVASGHAAAGPDLRAALGGAPAFRGERVRVCAGSRCLWTTLTDACACGDRNGRPTLIDLARADFARLGPLSTGVLLVTVELGAKPLPTLPNTDTEEVPDGR